MSSDKKTFIVEIEEVRVHQYSILDVHNSSEAEAVAEAWLEDGEEGAILSREILGVDSYPVENKEDLLN